MDVAGHVEGPVELAAVELTCRPVCWWSSARPWRSDCNLATFRSAALDGTRPHPLLSCTWAGPPRTCSAPMAPAFATGLCETFIFSGVPSANSAMKSLALSRGAGLWPLLLPPFMSGTAAFASGNGHVSSDGRAEVAAMRSIGSTAQKCPTAAPRGCVYTRTASSRFLVHSCCNAVGW